MVTQQKVIEFDGWRLKEVCVESWLGSINGALQETRDNDEKIFLSQKICC